MDFHDTMELVSTTWQDVSVHFRKLPGSAILVRYIQNSYQNDPVRSIVELLLFLFAVRYLLAPRYSTKHKATELTESVRSPSPPPPHSPTQLNLTDPPSQEIDELVDDWTPEPLVAPPTAVETFEEEHRPIIAGPTGPKVKLINSSRTLTNLASYNYFNLVSSELIKERAITILRSYGVGACGPPNFYGTQDVHIATELEIARFLGLPACIVYAQSFSTISSVIPAFAKRGDIIVADRACNFAIQKGLQISRSTIKWYAHNDMADLERVLKEVAKDQARKPLTRRFIVTEGLFEATGDMPDLPTIIELKNKHKFRLILDETHSFGLLGRTGRGLSEHQNVDPSNIEMLIGSLAHSLTAGGGFCCGTLEVVEHQRISSSSYVFSAALPAMLSVTAAEAIKIIEGNPDMLVFLRELTKIARAQLERSEYIHITSAPENPRILWGIKEEVLEEKGIEDVERLLADVVEECVQGGVLISRCKRVKDGSEGWQYGDGLCMMCVSVGHTKKDVEAAAGVVRKAVGKVLSRVKK